MRTTAHAHSFQRPSGAHSSGGSLWSHAAAAEVDGPARGKWLLGVKAAQGALLVQLLVQLWRTFGRSEFCGWTERGKEKSNRNERTRQHVGGAPLESGVRLN